jgi:hypothetical protein
MKRLPFCSNNQYLHSLECSVSPEKDPTGPGQSMQKDGACKYD